MDGFLDIFLVTLLEDPLEGGISKEIMKKFLNESVENSEKKNPSLH